MMGKIITGCLVVGIAIAAFVALVLSCMPRLDNGVVVSKRYEPATSTVMIMPLILSNGKTTTMIMVPYVVYDDPDWVLTVTGDDDRGERITEDWYISELQYSRVSVGDEVNRAKVSAKTEDPHQKTRVNQ